MRAEDAYLFVSIAESLSFKISAERRGLALSTVSKRVSMLEAEFGTRLVERTPRRVALTAAGLAFLDYCRRICEATDGAQAELQTEGVDPSGSLRLSVSSSLGIVLLPRLLREFAQRFPLIRVRAHLGDFHDEIRHGTCDIGIKIADRLPNSSLRVHRLGFTQYVLAAAPAYLSARGTPAELSDLAHHRCVGTTDGSKDTGIWNLRGVRGRESVAVTYATCATSEQTAIAAAVAGAGIVYAPRLVIASELDQRRLLPVLRNECSKSVCGIYALLPHAQPPCKVRVLMNFIEEQLPLVDGAGASQ